MSLVTLGLNHQTAPLELREQVAFASETTPAALQELVAIDGVDEALILSTCNRTELSCTVTPHAAARLSGWLHRHRKLAPGMLDRFLYRYDDAAAVRHMFRVATGLDSMVLGEPQILGQVKQAWQMAREAATLDTPMDRLMEHTFAVAKRVRTDTRIGANTVSVAFTAVRLAEEVFADLGQACVLLIGAGDTIGLAARHLAERKVRRLIVANRSLERAQRLASEHGGFAIGLDSLDEHLAEADIVISSTASPETILDAGMVGHALAVRRRRPMFLVDIAVPRDIDPTVGELKDVFLYAIDDLKQVIEDNLGSRRQEASEAEAIIGLQVERYMAWRRSLTLRNPVVAIRHQAEQHRDEVLRRARRLLASGRDSDDVLDYLARTLTNKLLHQPSAQLHQATLEGDEALLRAAEQLYRVAGDDDTAP